jgi:hypothetical protein
LTFLFQLQEHTEELIFSWRSAVQSRTNVGLIYNRSP